MLESVVVRHLEGHWTQQLASNNWVERNHSPGQTFEQYWTYLSLRTYIVVHATSSHCEQSFCLANILIQPRLKVEKQSCNLVFSICVLRPFKLPVLTTSLDRWGSKGIAPRVWDTNNLGNLHQDQHQWWRQKTHLWSQNCPQAEI